MSLDRRSFLRASSIAAAGVGAGAAFTTAKAHGQSGSGPANTQIYANCNSAHAIAAGQSTYGVPSGAVWNACANPLSSAVSDWESNHYDDQITDAVSRVNPNWMKSANLNQAQVLQAIQVYTPQFTAVDLQRSLAYIDSQSSEQIQGVISSLQQVGLLPYIKVLYSSAQLLAQYISANNPSGNRVVAPLFTLPTPPPSEPGGGQGSGGGNGGPAPVQGGGDGGGDGPQPPAWTCAADGAGVLVAGTAFAVITVMTLPISGPILLGEAWIAAATWGGLAAAGWGVGHFIGCGF